jgi:hypothetical protein
MSDPILDASTNVNPFGTPFYYLYDTNRDDTIPVVTSGSFTGYVGWVIRSYPTYYEDQEDIYRISLQSTSTIELQGLSAYVYNASSQYLGVLSPSDGALQFATGDYYLQFTSVTPVNYSVSINTPIANTPATFSNPTYAGNLVTGVHGNDIHLVFGSRRQFRRCRLLLAGS